METLGADSESEVEGGVGGMTTADGTAVATTANGVKETGSEGVSPLDIIKAEVIENKEVWSASEGMILHTSV